MKKIIKTTCALCLLSLSCFSSGSDQGMAEEPLPHSSSRRLPGFMPPRLSSSASEIEEAAPPYGVASAVKLATGTMVGACIGGYIGSTLAFLTGPAAVPLLPIGMAVGTKIGGLLGGIGGTLLVYKLSPPEPLEKPHPLGPLKYDAIRGMYYRGKNLDDINTDDGPRTVSAKNSPKIRQRVTTNRGRSLSS